jgi:drug/metabolite transporter (DMT)-like permease
VKADELEAQPAGARNVPGPLSRSDSEGASRTPFGVERAQRSDADKGSAREEDSRAPRRSNTTVHLLLLLMTLIWGANFPMIKSAMREMLPLAFTSVRFVIACVFLLGIQVVRRERVQVARADLRSVILVGAVGYALYQFAFSRGIAKASAGTSSLILAIVPILVALMGAAFKLERLTWRSWLGVLACLAGIVVVVLGGVNALEFGNLSGDVLVLAAAAMWAMSAILTRPLLGRYTTTNFTTVTMIVGTLVLIPLALPDILHQDWGAVSTRAWLGVLYSSALASALANSLWNIGLRRLGSTGTAVYANVTPVFAIAASWFVLGERITWVQLIGAAVVFIGLRLTQTVKVAQVVLPHGKGGS